MVDGGGGVLWVVVGLDGRRDRGGCLERTPLPLQQDPLLQLSQRYFFSI